MELRLLEYMLRVAELGSINKAAADLLLSQPALSRHIAALEEEMGTKLFVRMQTGVVPTDSGNLLIDRARPLLQQLSMLKEELGGAAAGPLTFGVPPDWRRVLTSRFVQSLVSEHPEIKLRIQERMTHLLREHMIAGTLDLCILPFESETPAGFSQIALVREPVIVLGSLSEGLTPNEPAELSRLHRVRLLLPSRANVLRSQLEHMLSLRGVAIEVAVETDSLGQCLRFAEQGTALTVVPACALTALSEYGLTESSIAWAPIRGLYMTWSLFESQARSHSRAVREGRRLLTDTLRGTIDAKIWYGVEPIGSLMLNV